MAAVRIHHSFIRLYLEIPYIHISQPLTIHSVPPLDRIQSVRFSVLN